MHEKRTRTAASAAVYELGWRYIFGTLTTAVRIAAPGDPDRIVARVLAADPGRSVRADVRPDRVLLTLQAPDLGGVSPREVELAGRISATLADSA
jgi:4a-hydroxytetrahydrobiopterin dehydratase